MSNKSDLQKQARVLSKEQRLEILIAFTETELHSHLKDLFIAMEPNYTVEVTHGPGELGKDLVIVKRDTFTTDVTGVVVKCGNITGKTLGEVDNLIVKVNAVQSDNGDTRLLREIESQIKQASTHPAELKSILKRLPINRILVVLAGRISGNARTRLDGELKANGDIYDIDKLIELFTEHFPQVFFDSRVVDFLQTKIEVLETKNWLVHSTKNLTEYFVEPSVIYNPTSTTLDHEAISLIVNNKKRTALSVPSDFRSQADHSCRRSRYR